MVFPLEAGIGLTPARAANAASLRTRPGCDHAVIRMAAVYAPTPGSSSRGGCWALCDQFDHAFLIRGERFLEGEDLTCETDRLVTGDSTRDGFLATSPP